jgi:predicted secreted Zn-dependent protease
MSDQIRQPGSRLSDRGNVIRVLIALLTVVLATIPIGGASWAHQSIAARSPTIGAGQAPASVGAALAQLRWRGSPEIWSPPPIDNVEIDFFDVSGTTQAELIASFSSSSICTRFGNGCSPDPAVPNGVAWALEGFHPAPTTYCFAPAATTLQFQVYIVIPRWSPPRDGTVKVTLVEAWNALAQVLYVHEAGHAAISIRDLAALNDQAHNLKSCDAVVAFWTNPAVFDQLQADQAAYHVRLHADCRPAIGCFPAGWMGW